MTKLFNRSKAENEKYLVEWIRQNEVQDIFSVTNKETSEVEYITHNRTADYSADEVLEDLE